MRVLGYERVVQKVWGMEAWIVNNGTYCGKMMYVVPGKRCSLHHHAKKHETFHVLDGTMLVEWTGVGGDEGVLVRPGEHVVIPPGQDHRFSAVGEFPVRFLEISTFHDENDVIRVEPSGDIEA